MKRKMRRIILTVLTAGILAAGPCTAHAEVIAKGGHIYSSEAQKSTEGETAEAFGHDPEAPAAARNFGYTEADARAAAEALYSFETNTIKKEIDVSYLLNSIWYAPENLYLSTDGKPMLRLYMGSSENYERAFLEALDGLDFFPNPDVKFLKNGKGGLLAGVMTGERFTEAAAYENYQTILRLLSMIREVQTAASGERDDADRAKMICDYVADRLFYDETHEKNCLADAVRSGVTSCTGYNSLTELLFEHCGLPYISITALYRDDPSAAHIFGLAKVSSTWLVFDTTNYDRDGAAHEPYWIFSDKYREGKFYTEFRKIEEQDTDPSSGFSV